MPSRMVGMQWLSRCIISMLRTRIHFPLLAPGEELPGQGRERSKAILTVLGLWGSEVRTCTGS